VRVDYVSADLSKVPNVEALWTEVLRLYPDGVDILINNAGNTLMTISIVF
jgi:short-subunit dehydrogenase